MNIESINMEPVAIGLYSLGVYTFITSFWPDIVRNFGWTLFLTGVAKHVSVIVLGLEYYFCCFCFQRVSRQLTETEIGKNPGGKEFRERLEYMLIGAFVEGCLYFVIGYGIYWIIGWKKGWNVFLTGIFMYYLAEFGGFRNILCNNYLFHLL
jgi:hypothetical protein